MPDLYVRIVHGMARFGGASGDHWSNIRANAAANHGAANSELHIGVTVRAWGSTRALVWTRFAFLSQSTPLVPCRIMVLDNGNTPIPLGDMSNCNPAGTSSSPHASGDVPAGRDHGTGPKPSACAAKLTQIDCENVRPLD